VAVTAMPTPTSSRLNTLRTVSIKRAIVHSLRNPTSSQTGALIAIHCIPKAGDY
jgi:hypothetical protein